MKIIEMNYLTDKNKRTAIIGTLLFHVGLILVLIFTGLKPPMPPRPEIGVQVNLGNSDQGMGDKQPKKPDENPATQQSNPESSKDPNDVVTQDQVETVKVNKQKKTNKTQPKTEPKDDPKPLDPRFDYKNRKKNNNTSNNSEGNDTKPGDKGQKNGDPNAPNYVGTPGGGVSFSLKGRVGKSLPEPRKDYSEEGTVVVQIWVNKSGKVINAVVLEKGTDTGDSKVRKMAIEAAYKSLFDAKPDAPETQVGTIEYIFRIGG